jgi:prepilin-type N-terminal cleavage/methylation domain-containing protein/prepilin-type processing-associated H-X9-DG protein
MHARNRNSAFTLIELLVVVAIISLLVSILLPSLAKAKELARSALCMTRLRENGNGVLFYTQDNDEQYLPFLITDPQYMGLPDWSWWRDLLAKTMNVSDKNEVFHCPSGESDFYYYCSYAANGHLGRTTIPDEYSAERLTDVKNPSTMILLFDSPIYEGRHTINIWLPLDFILNVSRRHLDDFNVLFCDTHIETQENDITEDQIDPR